MRMLKMIKQYAPLLGAIATLVMSVVGRVGLAEGLVADIACESSASDLKRTGISLDVHACCQRSFNALNGDLRSAQSVATGALTFESTRIGSLICVDQRQGETATKRNVFSGEKTRLSRPVHLVFGPVAGRSASRPALYILDEGGSGGARERVLAFNYRLSGDVAPDREMLLTGFPRTVSMAVDTKSEELLLLGSDNRLRRVSLFANNQSLNPADHPGTGNPAALDLGGANGVSIAYSVGLDQLLVLSDDGKVRIFEKEGDESAARQALGSIDVPGATHARALVVREELKGKRTAVSVPGAEPPFEFTVEYPAREPARQ